MRRIISISVCAMGLMGLSACDETDSTGVDRAFADVNVVDETNLNEVMLSAADPNEAVAYFQRATKEQPERIDLQRSLAMSLVRAKRNTEAVSAWKNVKKHEEAADTDRVELADALIAELGVPLKMINSAYRSPKYNAACPGAASKSYHTRNMALDLMFECCPKDAAKAAKKLRSRGEFKGGIGVYSSFIHIDTRGKNADWGMPV